MHYSYTKGNTKGKLGKFKNFVIDLLELGIFNYYLFNYILNSLIP